MARLGHAEIAATLVDLNGPAAIIAECDENLCGPNLTPAERALFTRRRKEAYEALHPETRHGGDRKSSRQLGDLPDRFTADTAAKTGQSERTIQRDATRAAKVAPEVLEQIKGTDLDRGSVIDEIAKAPRIGVTRFEPWRMEYVQTGIGSTLNMAVSALSACRASRTCRVSSRRCATTSAVRRPCFVRAAAQRARPFGVFGPVLAPP